MLSRLKTILMFTALFVFVAAVVATIAWQIHLFTDALGKLN